MLVTGFGGVALEGGLKGGADLNGGVAGFSKLPTLPLTCRKRKSSVVHFLEEKTFKRAYPNTKSRRSKKHQRSREPRRKANIE